MTMPDYDKVKLLSAGFSFIAQGRLAEQIERYRTRDLPIKITSSFHLLMWDPLQPSYTAINYFTIHHCQYWISINPPAIERGIFAFRVKLITIDCFFRIQINQH